MYLLILYALMNNIVFAFLLAVQICNVLFHGVRRVVDILIVSRDSFHQVCYLSLPHVDMHFFTKIPVLFPLRKL
jgi:hypothetical protein